MADANRPPPPTIPRGVLRPGEFLDRRSALRALNVSEDTLARRIKAGLPVHKFGLYSWFAADDLIDAIRTSPKP